MLVCYCEVSPRFFVIVGCPINSLLWWGLPIMVCYCRVSPCQQVPTHLKLHLLLSWGGLGASGGSWLPPPWRWHGDARGQCSPVCPRDGNPSFRDRRRWR